MLRPCLLDEPLPFRHPVAKLRAAEVRDTDSSARRVVVAATPHKQHRVRGIAPAPYPFVVRSCPCPYILRSPFHERLGKSGAGEVRTRGLGPVAYSPVTASSGTARVRRTHRRIPGAEVALRLGAGSGTRGPPGAGGDCPPHDGSVQLDIQRRWIRRPEILGLQHRDCLPVIWWVCDGGTGEATGLSRSPL